jgi:hypothetical protein
MFISVSTVEEIEKAIEKLPPGEFWALTERLIHKAEDAWDRQIAADVGSGKLDRLLGEARAEVSRGEAVPLDEFLRNA